MLPFELKYFQTITPAILGVAGMEVVENHLFFRFSDYAMRLRKTRIIMPFKACSDSCSDCSNKC